MEKITSEIPVQFEPKKPNRFQIIFPEITGIEPYYIKGLSKLSYDFKKKEWDILSFTLYDILGQEISKKVVKSLVNTRAKTINVKIQSLNPINEVCEIIEIIGEIIELDLGTYSYDIEDTISYIQIKIKPYDMTF